MKKMRDLERQFRQAGLLLEFDEGGGDGDYAYMGGGGGGASGDLYKVFLRPFMDVVDTARAGVESTISNADMLAKIAYSSVLAMIIPFISADYDAIFKKDAERQKNIANKYKEVFGRTHEALFAPDSDAVGIVSVLFPQYAIAKNIAQLGQRIIAGEKSADRAALSGIINSIGELLPPQAAVSAWWKELKRLPGKFGRSGIEFNHFDRFHTNSNILTESHDDVKLFLYGYDVDYENFIFEKSTKRRKARRQFERELKEKKLLKLLAELTPALGQSSQIKELQKEALESIQMTISALAEKTLKRMEELDRVQSIEDLERLTGKQFELSENIQDTNIIDVLNNNIAAVKTVIANKFNGVVEEYIKGILEGSKKLFVNKTDKKRLRNLIASNKDYQTLYQTLAKFVKKT